MLVDKLKVLYVDDEENNLLSFKAWFRKDYEIYTAKSAAEGFKILETINIHIFIADQRMPIMTGIEFLEKTIENFPDSIRLLITGQADIEIVIKAINQGQISKYISKPWQWDNLQLALENCSNLYKSKIELKLKNSELLKLNEELNKFVYSISHDVRSPLMSILGIVNLSKENTNLETKNEYFGMIESCVLKLDAYLKNIIDYYRNSRIDEQIEEVDFDILIKQIIETHRYQDNSVIFNTEVEQKEIFKGDIFRINVILSNLISNAIKYQNPDVTNHMVNIKITARDKSANISISDNGVGILNEHIKNIFQLFFRSHTPTNANGSGVGLYIVKEALDKIGGSINVTSTPLIRTTFEISIPNKK